MADEIIASIAQRPFRAPQFKNGGDVPPAMWNREETYGVAYDQGYNAAHAEIARALREMFDGPGENIPIAVVRERIAALLPYEAR